MLQNGLGMLSPGKILKALNPIRWVERTGKREGNYFYGLGGKRFTFATDSVERQIEAYDKCAPVAAILNRKARAFSNGKWWVLDKDGKEAKGSEAERIRSLLRRPNAIQTWRQFNSQAELFLNLFGEVFIFALTPVGMPDKVKALWVLPNWAVDVKLTGKMFMQTEVTEMIESYSLNYNGVKTVLPVESVLHLKDQHINTNEILRGRSRMVGLQDEVSNIIAAYESRNVLITRRGAIGVLSNESKDSVGNIPMSDEDKKNLQEDFQKYGLSRDQWQVIITNASLKWQAMSMPTKDLLLFEEIEDDVRQIADTYEYPMYLLGFKSGTTYSNVGEAKKSLYQDSIIPEAEYIAESLTSFLKADLVGLQIKVFYDHLDIFQQGEKEKADAFKVRSDANVTLYEKGIITLNQLLTVLDMDPRPDGDVFIYDLQKTPYAVKLGVGGTQALQSILADLNLTPQQKRNSLIVLFGLTEQEANQIVL